MLVNLEFDTEKSIWNEDFFNDDFFADMSEEERNLKQGDIIKKITDGIYQYWDVNPIILDGYDINHDKINDNCEWIGLLPYGVADNIEQILERDNEVKECIEDPNKEYILQVCYISKASQPDWGGWRWHKWGVYIGDFEPQHEYLYDEDEIDGVLVYQICNVSKI